MTVVHLVQCGIAFLLLGTNLGDVSLTCPSFLVENAGTRPGLVGFL